jgi:hypothetical protein
LKIPKGSSEAVNSRRTDNAMVKRKQTKDQTMIHKTLNRKTKIESKIGGSRYSGSGIETINISSTIKFSYWLFFRVQVLTHAQKFYDRRYRIVTLKC